MDWINWLPKFQPQEVRPNNGTYWERDDCTASATIDSIASQIFKITGVNPDLSVRFLATVSKTNYPGETPTPPWYGNSVGQVFQALLKYGVCTNSTWPTDVSVNDPTFYANPSSEAYAEALAWRHQWLPQLISGIQASQIPTALLKAPLLTEIVLGSPTDNPATGTPHLVEQLNTTQYADSILGQPQVKTFQQPPINYSQLIITPMNQTSVVLSKDGKTVYLCTPIAMDWANFLKQASVEGIEVPNPIPLSSSL